jgi:predicted phosphodiesterase
MAKKTAKQLKGLSRWELVNFYHLHVENDTGEFLTSRIWNWVKSYIENRFGGKEDYRAYPREGDNGVYRLLKNNEDKTVIAIASDWGTDTVESALVGNFMRQDKPDYSLHLGDVYYVGTPKEVEANFGRKGDDSSQGDWAYGSKGFLAVPGNHEFYSKGIGFYDNLLSKTFIQKPDGTVTKQKAGFFYLHNQHWRIIGLDTGYTSVGIPIIDLIIDAKCELKKEQISWLINEVKIGDPHDTRGIIIMSHHQYFSAFEKGAGFPRPAEQIAEILGEPRASVPVIWYWGHQHLLSFHEINRVGTGVAAYGRCIGHGGMPVDVAEIDEEEATNSKLQYYDPTTRQLDPETTVGGFNGYLKMTLDNEKMIAEHIQIEIIKNGDEVTATKKIVMTEEWEINLDTGTLTFDLKPETPMEKFTPNP